MKQRDNGRILLAPYLNYLGYHHCYLANYFFSNICFDRHPIDPTSTDLYFTDENVVFTVDFGDKLSKNLIRFLLPSSHFSHKSIA